MSDNPISDVLQQLPAIAQNAAKPEKSEPGPGDVGPSTETKGGNQLVTLKMSEDECREWWGRVERATQRRARRTENWDTLLKEYLPVVGKYGAAEQVKVNIHFRNVHTKIGQLFYRSPDLVLLPNGPGPADNTMPNPMAAMQPPGAPPLPPLKMEDIIAVKQEVLTKMMGRDGIKITRLMDELLFDVMAWAGIGCAKIGYRCVMKTIQKPVLGPDPTYVPPPAPPSMLGLQGPPPAPMVPQMGPDGQPQMQPEQVPIHEEWYMRRFSPKKWLCNDDLRSTRYDEDCTWQGMDFYMSPKKAMKAFGLTESEANIAATDENIHKYEEDNTSNKTPGLVHGIEIWLKSSVFTDELHPLAYTQLVLIEGIKDRPVVYRPSPDQEFDENGQLTENSLIGNPIRVLTLRDLADSCYVPADSAWTNPHQKQLSTWRRQSIKLRDVNIGKFLFDTGAFDDTEIEAMKNGEAGEFIPVGEGKLAQGADKIVAAMTQVHMTPDDARGEALLKQDVDETLGISAPQAGVPESTVRTATEIQTVNSGAMGRNDKELSRSVDFYLDAVRMLDQLLMRYADNNQYVHIVGKEGAMRMQMWNSQMISGKWLYDIAPDSQMRADSARETQLDMNMYNIAGKDPLLNRGYVLRRIARGRGWDPSKAVIDPTTLPPPKPEPVVPNIGFSFKGEDLANPLVLQILEKAELITAVGQPPGGGAAPPAPGGAPHPPLAAPPQPPHPGAMQHAESISQHMASNSGGLPNRPGAENTRQTQVK